MADKTQFNYNVILGTFDCWVSQTCAGRIRVRLISGRCELGLLLAWGVGGLWGILRLLWVVLNPG
jgi:hypothetical protein